MNNIFNNVYYDLKEDYSNEVYENQKEITQLESIGVEKITLEDMDRLFELKIRRAELFIIVDFMVRFQKGEYNDQKD